MLKTRFLITGKVFLFTWVTANTSISLPPSSFLNFPRLHPPPPSCCTIFLTGRSTGSCCPAWRPRWRVFCPPTTPMCGLVTAACSASTRTWTTSWAMGWRMSRSELKRSDLYLFVFNPVSKQITDHFLPVLEDLQANASICKSLPWKSAWLVSRNNLCLNMKESLIQGVSHNPTILHCQTKNCNISSFIFPIWAILHLYQPISTLVGREGQLYCSEISL